MGARVNKIFFYLLIVVFFAFVFLAAFALAPDEISGIHLGYWFAGLFVSINLVLISWVMVRLLAATRD